MPCRDDSGYDPLLPIREAQREADARVEEAQKKLDRVTRLLCDLLQRVPACFVDEKEHTELFVWWKAHQEADKNRKAEERKRINARKRELKRSIEELKLELEELDE